MIASYRELKRDVGGEMSTLKAFVIAAIVTLTFGSLAVGIAANTGGIVGHMSGARVVDAAQSGAGSQAGLSTVAAATDVSARDRDERRGRDDDDDGYFERVERGASRTVENPVLERWEED